MPLTLVPPNLSRRSPNYRVRGTYLGIRVDRSTETSDKRKAQAFLNRIKDAIERGAFSAEAPLTLAAAISGYVHAGGEKRFLKPILDHFGKGATVVQIDQTAIDNGAASVYPNATPATRNRQFYTPLLAVLRHAGIEKPFKRPKGSAGNARNTFLTPEQFERVAIAAVAEDEEFGVLVILLCYTGLRLSEALRIKCPHLEINEARLFCGKTKNGDPRPVHLPPRVVAALANHPRGLERKDRLFHWSKCGELYIIARRVYARAAVDHGGAPFHVLRHTYGAWMTRAGADLVGTGAWRSPSAARVYQHFVVTEEARKSDVLPGSGAVKKRTE